MDARELVKYIVGRASERGNALTLTRLVKFLYLADLYVSRITGGKTLTGWPWAFLHYGPYCTEARDAIGAAVNAGIITAAAYESRYDGEERHVYKCAPVSLHPALLPITAKVSLDAAIRTWADDTPGLLDHVYFETEPMAVAEPGAVLDFGTARTQVRDPPIEMRRLSKKKIEKGRDLIRRLMRRQETQLAAKSQASRCDEALTAALSALDDDDLECGAGGEAKLSVARRPGEEANGDHTAH